jgi:hypothetical protein
MRAEALLKDATNKLDELLVIRIKGKKYEYKERGEFAVGLVTQFRAAVKTMREQQRQFVNDAASIEEALLQACEAANVTLASTIAEADELRVNYQLAEREKASAATELANDKATKDALAIANDAAKAELFEKGRNLDAVTEKAEELDRSLLEAVKVAENLSSAKDEVSSAAAKAAEEAAATLTTTTEALKKDFETRVAALTAKESSAEAAALAAARDGEAAAFAAAQEKTAGLEVSLEAAVGARDSEAKAKEILEIQLVSAKEQLSAKASELTIALGSLGEIQRSHADREAQLRDAASASDAKATSIAAELQKLKDTLQEAKHAAEVASQEFTSCKAAAARLEVELAVCKATAETNSAEANKLKEELAVEKELRGRAETREVSSLFYHNHEVIPRDFELTQPVQRIHHGTFLGGGAAREDVHERAAHCPNAGKRGKTGRAARAVARRWRQGRGGYGQGAHGARGSQGAVKAARGPKIVPRERGKVPAVVTRE